MIFGFLNTALYPFSVTSTGQSTTFPEITASGEEKEALTM